MNYLAHAYLSFSEPEILVGNMISDFVKGKKKFDYPPNIQKGITLHRAIDEYTDHHPATKKAITFFKKEYRLYAGAFVDIVYDHFLATDKKEFADPLALKNFAATTYQTLEGYVEIFPERFKTMFPYMQEQDWLYNYQFNEGMQKSFNGLIRRATYLTNAAPAYDLFVAHYDALKICYGEFFPELKGFAAQQLIQLSEK